MKMNYERKSEFALWEPAVYRFINYLSSVWLAIREVIELFRSILQAWISADPLLIHQFTLRCVDSVVVILIIDRNGKSLHMCCLM
jgi:hypothetical protein